jgi:hypothetical protein
MAENREPSEIDVIIAPSEITLHDDDDDIIIMTVHEVTSCDIVDSSSTLSCENNSRFYEFLETLMTAVNKNWKWKR